MLLAHLDLWLKKYPPDCLHVFLAMHKNKEPDCAPLWSHWWDQSIKTITTQTNFKSKTVQHLWFDASTDIQISDRGIPEPQTEKVADLQQVNVILVPLLSFDQAGHRLGYGGGYYDQILPNLPSAVIKVGLSLAGGMEAFNFVEPHDIPLDLIITPFELKTIS